MGIEAELELPEMGLTRTLKDLFAGAVGGVAQVLLGTYIDLISLLLFQYLLIRLFFSSKVTDVFLYHVEKERKEGNLRHDRALMKNRPTIRYCQSQITDNTAV